MAENPQTWSELEHLIHQVYAEHVEEREAGLPGFTLAAKLSKALVEEGFIDKDKSMWKDE